MNKFLKIMDKKGRITIPFEIRQNSGYQYNDIISLTPQKDGSIVIRREKLCDDCISIAEETEPITIEELLDSLSQEEQRDALVYLSSLWAERRKGRGK